MGTGLDKVDVVVIGAGVVGLAIGAAIADKGKEMYILEKEEVYGQGTSSRNSEVIHAGIYYPSGSLKAELCVKANPMLYEICEKHNVPYKKCGKLIVGNGEAEVAQLRAIVLERVLVRSRPGVFARLDTHQNLHRPARA